MPTSGLLAKGVPPQPAFLRILKFIIIFLSVIVLAIAAYAISIFSSAYGYYGNGGVSGLLIFACVKTWIIFGIALFLEMRAQHLFWRIILIIAYFISIIFWLSAWAWSASAAGVWLSFSDDYDCSYDSNFNYVCNTDSNGPWKREGAALAACAGLGAVIWVLCIVHFAFFIIACLRDTQGTGAGSHQAELGQVKAQEAYPAQQQQQPQQPYPAQQPQQPYEQSPYQQPHQQTYPTQ